jgi:hypothetical protein
MDLRQYMTTFIIAGLGATSLPKTWVNKMKNNHKLKKIYAIGFKILLALILVVQLITPIASISQSERRPLAVVHNFQENNLVGQVYDEQKLEGWDGYEVFLFGGSHPYRYTLVASKSLALR